MTSQPRPGRKPFLAKKLFLLLWIPYYTGLIAHLPGTDLVKQIPFARLLHTSPGLVLERLTVNRPDWVRPAGIGILVFLYLAATVAAVLIAFRSARQGFGATESSAQA